MTVDAREEQKRRSHQAILASAAMLLRRQGIRATSVSEVMKGAGLTVGGFYGHFASKEQLFAETLRDSTSSMWSRLLKAATASGTTPRARLERVLSIYLAPAHRDGPDDGCLLPTAAPEAAREGEPYRTALEHQLGGSVRGLTQLVGGKEKGRRKALALMCLMYGALSLSRAVAGTPLSDELLEAARAAGLRLAD